MSNPVAATCAGVRVFAGPQDGAGGSVRVDLGEYGVRTGKAVEPPPVAALPATQPCPGGACQVQSPDPPRVPQAPVPDTGSRL